MNLASTVILKNLLVCSHLKLKKVYVFKLFSDERNETSFCFVATVTGFSYDNNDVV